jgi:actin-like ATPase involved in cell morphogenesis
MRLFTFLTQWYSTDLAIDLGTANTLIYAKKLTADQAIHYVLNRRMNSLKNKFQ